MIDGQPNIPIDQCTHIVRPRASVEWTFASPVELGSASFVLRPGPQPRRVAVHTEGADGMHSRAGHAVVAAGARVACLALPASIGVTCVGFSIDDAAAPHDPFVDVRLYDLAGRRLPVEMRRRHFDANTDVSTARSTSGSHRVVGAKISPRASAIATVRNSSTHVSEVGALTPREVAGSDVRATDRTASRTSARDTDRRTAVASGHEPAAVVAADSTSTFEGDTTTAQSGRVGPVAIPRGNDEAEDATAGAAATCTPVAARIGVIARAFAAFAFLHPRTTAGAVGSVEPSEPIRDRSPRITRSARSSVGGRVGNGVETPQAASRNASAFVAAVSTAPDGPPENAPPQATSSSASSSPSPSPSRSPSRSPSPSPLPSLDHNASGAQPSSAAAGDAVAGPGALVRFVEPRPVRGRCQYCGLDQPALFDPTVLQRHHIEACPFLTTCPMCAEAVPVPDIHPHMSNDCRFRARVRTCARCCRAFRVGKAWKRHVQSGDCVQHRGGLVSVCPLCDTQLVDGSQAHWHAHLCRMTPPCVGNPRPAPPVLHA